MPTFNPNIPQPPDLLSNSQGILLTNNQALDASFGIDHYAFSNATSNNGFHNTVTTPLIVGSAHPTTAAAIPKFYAMQDSANLGVIQYSRGPNNSAPSPVTIYQSPVGAVTINAGSTVNIFDFTGLTRAMCHFQAMDTSNVAALGIIAADIFYNGGSPGTFAVTTYFTSLTSKFQFQISGNILVLKNNSAVNYTNVYWSLQFLRTT